MQLKVNSQSKVLHTLKELAIQGYLGVFQTDGRYYVIVKPMLRKSECVVCFDLNSHALRSFREGLLVETVESTLNIKRNV